VVHSAGDQAGINLIQRISIKHYDLALLPLTFSAAAALADYLRIPWKCYEVLVNNLFLGPDYDDQLKAVYTTTSTAQIARNRNVIVAVFADSMVDTAPLREMIRSYIDTDVIEAIAREYKGGLRLYIGTINLDANRSVIWSIGAIATSDYPHKPVARGLGSLLLLVIVLLFPPLVCAQFRVEIESADPCGYP